MRSNLINLLLLPVVLVGCDTEHQKVQSHIPAMASAPSQAVPSVKQAMIKAIELTNGHGIFSRHHNTAANPDKSSSILHRSIEVAGRTQNDGSVRVAFSIPTSGRLPTQKLFEVTFTKAGTTSRSFGQKPKTISATDGLEAKITKAIARVVQSLPDKPVMEFAVSAEATIEAKSLRGISVLISAVPYMPGAYTLYLVSSDFKQVRALR